MAVSQEQGLHDHVQELAAESRKLRRGGDAIATRDRRTQARAAFECVQLIAPYDGVKLPTQADFRHVLCSDLSTSGISFITPQRPATERIVVALGSIPFSFVVADIVRIEPTDEGELLIGCRFVERLKM